MSAKLKSFSLVYLLMLIALVGCLQNTNPTEIKVIQSASPTKDTEPVYEKGRVQVGARLREEPSPKAKVVDTLSAGTLVKVIEKVNDWYKISVGDGKEGYIYYKLIKIITTTDAPNKADLQPVNEPQIMLPDKTTYFTVRSANLRQGPGTEYDPPITTVKAGSQFIADGYRGSWYHGTVQDKTGWIHLTMLDSRPPSENLQAAGGQTPAPEDSIQSPKSSIASEQSSSKQAPQNQSGNSVSSPSQTKNSISSGKAYISSLAPIKLRSHPNPLGKAIEELPAGSEVTVLENQGAWCKVKTDKNTGFVTTESLSPGGK